MFTPPVVYSHEEKKGGTGGKAEDDAGGKAKAGGGGSVGFRAGCLGFEAQNKTLRRRKMGFMERAARKERAEAKERQWPAGNFGLTLRLLREMPDEKMRDFMREVDRDEAEGMVSRWEKGASRAGL